MAHAQLGRGDLPNRGGLTGRQAVCNALPAFHQEGARRPKFCFGLCELEAEGRRIAHLAENVGLLTRIQHKFVKHPATDAERPRSEERRVGKACVSTCRSRWSPHHLKKT